MIFIFIQVERWHEILSRWKLEYNQLNWIDATFKHRKETAENIRMWVERWKFSVWIKSLIFHPFLWKSHLVLLYGQSNIWYFSDFVVVVVVALHLIRKSTVFSSNNIYIQNAIGHNKYAKVDRNCTTTNPDLLLTKQI